MENFFERVYEIVKLIPKGKVATYGMIAKLLGAPRSSRAVGYALHANPDHDHIPCHRVVNRLGELSKAFVFGGENAQKAFLEMENVEFLSDGRVNLEKCLWNGK